MIVCKVSPCYVMNEYKKFFFFPFFLRLRFKYIYTLTSVLRVSVSLGLGLGLAISAGGSLCFSPSFSMVTATVYLGTQSGMDMKRSTLLAVTDVTKCQDGWMDGCSRTVCTKKSGSEKCNLSLG